MRESRRVIGRYELTREDVLGGRRFEDAVARASWPIELWCDGRLGAEYEYLDEGAFYEIPLRCLRARDVDNLFAVGRCMSATHEALGSARVIGTCLAAGVAAGEAAAREAAAGPGRDRRGRARGRAVNLADLLYASAARHSGRPAVSDVCSGQTLVYGELGAEAERVARFLLARGVEPGQRIGLVAPNGPGHVAAAFGLLTAGACLVPVAAHLTPAEMAQLLARIHVNGCLSWPGCGAGPGALDRARLSGGACDGFAFEWIDREAEGPAPFRGLDPAFIRFTSGTTDRCKGVVLSHEATAARVEGADRVLRFHRGTASSGSCRSPTTSPSLSSPTCGRERTSSSVRTPCPGPCSAPSRRLRATVLYASPLHFERLGHQRHGPPLGSLRLALSTSAPIAAGTMARFESAHGVPVSQAYGIIEAGLPCINVADHAWPPTSVGGAIPGYEIAAFGDGGERLGPGAPGEIGVRGSGLFSAYYAPWTPR